MGGGRRCAPAPSVRNGRHHGDTRRRPSGGYASGGRCHDRGRVLRPSTSLLVRDEVAGRHGDLVPSPAGPTTPRTSVALRVEFGQLPAGGWDPLPGAVAQKPHSTRGRPIRRASGPAHWIVNREATYVQLRPRLFRLTHTATRRLASSEFSEHQLGLPQVHVARSSRARNVRRKVPGNTVSIRSRGTVGCRAVM